MKKKKDKSQKRNFIPDLCRKHIPGWDIQTDLL